MTSYEINILYSIMSINFDMPNAQTLAKARISNTVDQVGIEPKTPQLLW